LITLGEFVLENTEEFPHEFPVVFYAQKELL
jgi:hypothetical protein